ncbi:MAG: hypothetical protein ACUVXA_05380 [Candidatus Jordarchaeum sp.]|uniref:hypothetical protein n=1 Tax=Candidatus Jordarchaeum sp. TaxID=2823881 RepID=UPI00404B0BBB
MDKAFMLGIIKGYKIRNYLASVEKKSIKLFDREKSVGKLSKSQIYVLESKGINYLKFSEIEDFNDIVNII